MLKSKIAKTKNKDELIEELLRGLSKQNAKLLKEALDELFLMIYDNFDNANLKILVENKINALQIGLPNINYETLYEGLASSAGAKFVFDEVDIKSLEAMRKNFYWVKNDYNQKISNDLKAITEQVFAGNIARAEMAEALKEKFKGVLSANISYFEGVSDHIISQAQNIARVNQSSKYGVKHYKVVARIDEKTSDICRSMNGRIIPASHIELQSSNIQNAKSINEKKAASAWRSEPFYGKILPANFGLPPYHFRCRTELVPVWIDEEEIDGVKMKNTSPLSKDEAVKHIDKTGVERVLSKQNYFGENNHSEPLYKRVPKSDVVKALNSINTMAKNKDNKYINAFSDNGYFIVFNGNEIVTCYKHKDGNKATFNYFKKRSLYDKKEVIKWKIANLL
nr:hypothetical protein [Campylobacter fetus]